MDEIIKMKIEKLKHQLLKRKHKNKGDIKTDFQLCYYVIRNSYKMLKRNMYSLYDFLYDLKNIQNFLYKSLMDDDKLRHTIIELNNHIIVYIRRNEVK